MNEDHIHLGDWRIEPARNVLARADSETNLEPRAMDVLVHLAECAPRTVSADELLDKFWAGRVVESSTVHRTVNKIRRALGDDPRNARYLETVPKRGYRVVAPVTMSECRDPDADRTDLTVTEFLGEPAPPAYLSEPADTLGIGRLELGEDAFRIGRGEGNDCVLRSSGVSKRHATLSVRGDYWVITNENATNGVVVNGKRVENVRLNDGDRIKLGRIELLFELAPTD